MALAHGPGREEPPRSPALLTAVVRLTALLSPRPGIRPQACPVHVVRPHPRRRPEGQRPRHVQQPPLRFRRKSQTRPGTGSTAPRANPAEPPRRLRAARPDPTVRRFRWVPRTTQLACRCAGRSSRNRGKVGRWRSTFLASSSHCRCGSSPQSTPRVTRPAYRIRSPPTPVPTSSLKAGLRQIRRQSTKAGTQSQR